VTVADASSHAAASSRIEKASGAAHASHTFRTSTSWLDGTTGLLSAEGKPTLRVSTPPEFRGERGVWTPEDLFVGSVEICHMATFMSFARRNDIPITSYRSHANGVLEYVGDDFRFTRIVIFPTITIPSAKHEQDVHELLKETSHRCLVTNSIASIVEINPTIVVE
jgi:organic hydroperoxide reductase OsmC/OhrA